MDHEKVFFEGSERKEGFLKNKNMHSKTTKILSFQRGWSMVYVKKWRFFNLQFLCKMDRKSV